MNIKTIYKHILLFFLWIAPASILYAITEYTDSISPQEITISDILDTYNQGDFIKSIKLSEIKLVDKSLEKEVRLHILRTLSAAYQELEFYENVIIVKKEIAELLSNKNQKTIPSLWDAYLNLGLYQEALDNFRITNPKENEEHPASILNNEGYIFLKWGKLDSALVYFHRAVKEVNMVIEEENKKDSPNNYHQIFKNMILGNIGQCYFHQGKYAQAKPYLIADNITSKLRKDTEFNLVVNYHYLAEISLELKSYQEAKLYLDSSRTLLTRRQDMEAQVKFLYLLSQYYKEMNLLDSAIFFLDEHLKLKDSVYALKHNSSVTNNLLSYDLQLYKSELKSNENKINIIERAIQNEIIIRYILLSGLFILIIFFVNYIFYNKKLKKNQKVLEEQNMKINKQKQLLKSSLNEKEILLKEVHHRVKNNLQVISGLFEMQKDSFSDPSIIKILEDSQRRVTSISIVHQKLYEFDDYSNIQFKDYVKTITNSVIVSHSKPNQKIRFELDIEDFLINIDAAVPIGLILNELITNAIKYGIQDNKSGLIIIKASKKGEEIDLRIKDSNDENIIIDLDKSTGIGFKLIKGLAWQLNGTFRFDEVNQEFVLNFQLKQ